MKSSRRLVFCCTGSDCKKEGSKHLRKEISQAAKEGELKGKVQLIKTKCMDRCKSAPIIIAGDHFCKKATLEKVLDKLKKL
jgi:NADH:ubiquinone oxidoreductase subunit E